MKEGHISSIETMGLVDGPGIRFVVFFSGCRLRCRFCHNPDTWNPSGGEIISSEDLMKKILKMKAYFERSGGGVTFSGGEPLLQAQFLLEMLRLCKENGVHTCIDTAGAGVGMYDEILSFTDLVLYDVKALKSEDYKKLCLFDIDETEKFQAALRRNKTKTIVRQVVIPGLNDNDDYMTALKDYVKEKIPAAEKIELLPYHKMGEYKYKSMNIPDPLAGTAAMDKKKTDDFQKKYFESL